MALAELVLIESIETGEGFGNRCYANGKIGGRSEKAREDVRR